MAHSWLERAQPQVPKDKDTELGPRTIGNIVDTIDFR